MAASAQNPLRDLAARGLVQRVHGGALAPAPQPGDFATRSETATAEEAAIARAVAGLLAGARVLLIDGSTTNLEVVRLPDTEVGTVLTNSPPIAVALADHPTPEVVVIGGRMDKRARVTVGASRVSPRVAATGLLVVNGAVIGVWVSQIPGIQERRSP